MLNKSTVVKALQTPYKRVLDFAFSYVSLSARERNIIELIYIDGNTEEMTADMLNLSRDSVAKIKGGAMHKLRIAWETCEVLRVLTEY